MLELISMQREALDQCLDDGALVVTGNLRLQRALLAAYEQRASDNSLEVWATPDILQWSTWLERCWQDAVLSGELSSDALLLSAEQEHQAWTSIIGRSTFSVLRQEAAAEQAGKAWQLLQQWQYSRDREDYFGNIDTRAFYQWCEAFETACEENGWLARAHIPALLTDLLDRTHAAPAEKMLLVGFDALHPAQVALCQALQQAGCQVQWIELAGKDAEAARVVYPDQRAEVEAFSRWARNKLEQDLHVSIGLVAHDLAAVRSLVNRTLAEVLAPAGQQPGVALEQQPWNISLGLPLVKFGIIATALDILDLARHECSMETVGSILRSPYITGAASETGARALLDAKLRQAGVPVVSLKTVRFRSNEKDEAWYSPVLSASLAALETAVAAGGKRYPASHWASLFSAMLNATGWGRDRTLTSDEYQAIEAWGKVLASFSGLDQVSGDMSYTKALSTLRRLCSEKIFQPRTAAAPVQVLGVYEAIGQQFDALWVMGMHDGCWPAAPRPNPFIPLWIQREAGMPHADQAGELATAKLITRRLLTSAATIVMSSPARQGEENLRTSPLITDLPLVAATEIARWNDETWLQRVRDAGDVVVLDNDHAPPCDQAEVSGGSGIFRSQSLCPFRAFAEFRLGASGLETMQVGLDAKQRGSLLHEVLELFWRQVGSQASLAAMSDAQRNDTLASVIRTALDKLAQESPGTLTRRFIAIESARLQELALAWLDQELLRAPFSVDTLEMKRSFEINGINVRLKIDRVDVLDDGRRIVIDYKTGNVTPSHWFGDRPEEPQLPLYSVAEGDGVCAVLYGQIRADVIGFSGVVAEQGLVPGLPGGSRQLKQATEDWPQVLEDWQLTVDRLAGDFMAGRAEVDPKKPGTCTATYCKFAALCRIDERDEFA
jgi:probable DNA repair protein